MPRKLDLLCGKEITQFANRLKHVLALTKNGDVLSWRQNGYGQLGKSYIIARNRKLTSVNFNFLVCLIVRHSQ